MKKLVLFLILTAVALTAGAYWINNRQANSAEAGYTTASVEYGSMVESISATGLLKPQDLVIVASKVPGEVVEIYASANFNKVVREGDPLVRLDDRMARKKLEQAEITVRLAEADVATKQALQKAAEVAVKRLKDLREKDQSLAPQADIDKAQAGLDAARTAVHAAEIKVQEAKAGQEQAQLGLEWTTVRVPTFNESSAGVAGEKRKFTVIDRKVEIGQQVGPPTATPLFTLAGDLSQLQLLAQVAEGDVGKVRAGLTTDFTVSTSSEENEVHFRGKVSEVRLMPTNVHGAVFYEAAIDVRNERDPETKDWRLRPGMTASVDIIRREHANVWKAPTAALNLQVDERRQSEETKAKLARWQQRPDADNWKPVWVLDDHHKPVPLMVRVNGKNAAGQSGIKDAQFTEVLDWDPDLAGRLDPKNPDTFPHVLISVPGNDKTGLFKSPIKL